MSRSVVLGLFAYNLEKADIWQRTVALMVLRMLEAMGTAGGISRSRRPME